MKHSLRAFTFTLISLCLCASAVSAGTLRLAWDPAPSATGYILSYGVQSRTYASTIDVGAATTYTLTNLANGERYYVSVQAYNSTRLLSQYSVEVNGFPETTAIPPGVPRTPTDLDGDGRADIAVWHFNDGYWSFLRSTSSYAQSSAQSLRWGDSSLGDRPVAADYDGDGFMDIAVWRPGTPAMWYILNSSHGYSTYSAMAWGTTGDIPVPGDYDGDGKADIAVWRPSGGIWIIRTSSSNYATYFIEHWGLETDIPLVGDFDGDGRADITVWRPADGTWYVKTSTTGYASWFAVHWGVETDIPLVGDFDGDGRADITVWRPTDGTWYIKKSSTGYASWFAVHWGLDTDIPVVGDFDGDGRDDITVWRASSGLWCTKTSTSNYASYFVVQWAPGSLKDQPISATPR